ncbi:hypothetical protein K435DRAFT_799617 [Dendrothele bispora CBS 962.96]|uniref:Uncharacterized protein n=1 Tax=Dendrothele bispora (strain CBS 962.96) TaxID=1314807 RepID=A0A4S8LVC2_DENBC|nr:hypothetical protein K435DRAFT_799617 [Dendrothele bispora CBS 962.96]
MAYLSGSSGSALASLLVRYRKKAKAYAPDYSDPGVGSEEDDYDAGGVGDRIGKVIKDIGLEGQIQPVELLDLLIRGEFPAYSERQFYLETRRKEVSLQDVISGLD